MPSIVYFASWAAWLWAKPKSAASLPVTEIVFAAPVDLPESTIWSLITVA